jgi:hypothetical protein
MIALIKQKTLQCFEANELVKSSAKRLKSMDLTLNKERLVLLPNQRTTQVGEDSNLWATQRLLA